ncbi:MAG: sugar phosphate isomerase/epimerase [Acutalibacteraceae bacterium]|nr:sugar phosphate isomerase/epimerase [Acutalibacteraceae bacterium]
MIDFPIGLQLYSVRDDLAADFEGTLKKVKAMGYDGVEFAGLHGRSAAQVKALCAELGLNPISAHVPFVDMMNNPEILKDYKEIGCEFVVIPYLTEEYRPGHPKFSEVIEGAKFLATKCAELGLKLCYHNHDFEFVKVGDEYAIDILYAEVPELMPEFDTCWVNVGGEDPAAYVRKYAGREEILHLKDFVGGKSENMYALIGIDENEEKDAGGKFELRPVGYGVQDFPGILAAAKEVGIRWVVVEQDNPSMGKTPLECAETSINYLKSL